MYCMAGTQGNVGARPMGSGVQWARGGALMRVKANTKYTKHDIHILIRVEANTKYTKHDIHMSYKNSKHARQDMSKQRLRSAKW